MATSRISTALTEMPQSAVLRAISVRSTSSAALRSDNSSDEVRGADHFAQGRLRHPVDGQAIVGDVERGALRVVHMPEDDGVDIDRHGVAGERLLGVELRGLDALVDDGGDGVDAPE